MEETKEDMMKQTAQFFFDSKTPVHIELRNGRFYNGAIKYVGADFVLIIDMKLGEMPCFFSGMDSIEPYREKVDG